MEKLSHRERLLIALNHQEPDRVPLDFGSTFCSTMIEPGYDRLKEYLGMEHDNRIMMARQGSVLPDDEVLDRLGIDTKGMVLGDYSWGHFRIIDENTQMDFWQTTWKRAPGGHFYNIDGPFQGHDPMMDELETFDWPDPDNPGLYEGLKAQAKFLRRNSDRALVLNFPVGIVHQGQFLRGFEDWLLDLYRCPEYIARLSEKLADIWVKMARNAMERVGHLVDVAAIGDDLAMQQGPLFNPEIYRRIIKPQHRRMIQAVKDYGPVKAWYHTCGSAFNLIDDLIDIGVDILNPVQVAANNMDPRTLKKEFGGRICFWGGVDTQSLLPFAEPDAVRAGVREIMSHMCPGGGYVLTSVHNMQNDVPAKNIVAMFDEARAVGGYTA
jgi:uroporphyrinogen decarboxylase